MTSTSSPVQSAEALTKLATYAKKQGIDPDKFRAVLVQALCDDASEQIHEVYEAAAQLVTDLSRLSTERSSALDDAFTAVYVQLAEALIYLGDIEEHPQVWLDQ